MAANRNHKPRKRFGQHFLTDTGVIHRMVTMVNLNEFDHLVEIGPGQGALTDALVERTASLTLIELDRDLIAQLQARYVDVSQLKIHQGDALQVNYGELSPAQSPIRIIGNLPYNISTPLLLHLTTYVDDIQDMHFMLQKEVVDRIAASPNNKTYGRLSIMMQYHYAATALFDVPPAAFNPPPKVQSAIVRLVPHRVKPHAAKDYAIFSEVVRLAFNQRRKMVRNSLSSIMTGEQLEQLGIAETVRPEQLSVADFVKISNNVKEIT